MAKNKKILLTGGLGFIGSHVAISLSNEYDVFIIDNLQNSEIEQLSKIKTISGKKIEFLELDLTDRGSLNFLFKNYNFDVVVHCAGVKSVEESEKNPKKYYEDNIIATSNLINLMDFYNVNNLVFSSSACVYSAKNNCPIKEESPIKPNNVYGKTKYVCELTIKNIMQSHSKWNGVILRYFNPIGAHSSGIIGDNPLKNKNNIMPVINECLKKNKIFKIFGNNFKTKDGTAIRDYIHIEDLATSHLKAVKFLDKKRGLEIINIGTGVGYTVLDIINNYPKKIKYTFVEKRKGDVEKSFTDTKKAKKILNFTARKTIQNMCLDAERFYDGL